MKSKIEVILTIATVFIVTIAIAAFTLLSGPIGYEEITTAAILIVIVIFAVPILWGKAKNIKYGLPAKDERITGINYKEATTALWRQFGPQSLPPLWHTYCLGSNSKVHGNSFSSNRLSIRLCHILPILGKERALT